MVANTQRNFTVAGITGFENQGGNSGGCGIPFGPATAVMINFAAAEATGSGNIRAWAVANLQPAAPLAAVMNFGTAMYALANGVAVPICDPAVSSCTTDLRLQADVSSVHVVATWWATFVNWTFLQPCRWEAIASTQSLQPRPPTSIRLARSTSSPP